MNTAHATLLLIATSVYMLFYRCDIYYACVCLCSNKEYLSIYLSPTSGSPTIMLLYLSKVLYIFSHIYAFLLNKKEKTLEIQKRKVHYSVQSALTAKQVFFFFWISEVVSFLFNKKAYI